jgi:hypothetical protein
VVNLDLVACRDKLSIQEKIAQRLASLARHKQKDSDGMTQDFDIASKTLAAGSGRVVDAMLCAATLAPVQESQEATVAQPGARYIPCNSLTAHRTSSLIMCSLAS